MSTLHKDIYDTPHTHTHTHTHTPTHTHICTHTRNVFSTAQIKTIPTSTASSCSTLMPGSLVPLSRPDLMSSLTKRTFLRKSANGYTLYGVMIRTLSTMGREGRREREEGRGLVMMARRCNHRDKQCRNNKPK